MATGSVPGTSAPTNEPEPRRDLRVRVLGAFEVEGVPSERLGSRKARTLLRALALGRGQPVPVDRLVDVCWGDAAPARPADDLSVLVSRLRGALGRERIVRHDGGYELVVDWLDLDAVAELAEEAALRLTTRGPMAARSAALAALALVRGPLLADEPDAAWADLDRAATARLVARVRHLAATTSLAAGHGAEAAALAEATLDVDPYDEVALRLLMAAFASAGRPASALAAYARTRGRVGDDLGAELDPETERVHTAILRGEPIPGIEIGVVTGTDPPGVDAAVELPGRHAELTAIAVALDRAAATGTRVVAIEGEAGIGKTTVLDAAARSATRAGAIVLRATCDELERALPLQVVGDAIEQHLRTVDRDDDEAILGDALPLVGPLLGRVGAATGSDTYALVEGAVGPALLFGALLDVLRRIAATAPVALVLDDMHLAGTSTVEWLRFVRRYGADCRLLVVVARRREEGGPLPSDETLALGPLDLAATELVVGPARARELFDRSGGHPLFLVELAAADPSDELPTSIRDAVAARCDGAGIAADTLRTAALLGSEVDLDLLASVVRRPPLEILEHLEEGTRRRILEARGSGFVFTHDLVRSALVAGTSASRAALVHREAARALAHRPGADPLDVAYHGRLGGDHAIAAAAYVQGAQLAAERFDYETAESLLDRSLLLADHWDHRLERARIRTLRERYAAAIEDADVALALGAGASALDVTGWTAYWARDLETARQCAHDVIRSATDPSTRVSGLLLAGRLLHFRGDLAGAEAYFVEAAGLAEGAGIVTASVYLGTLRSHQSRATEALDLMRAATRPGGSPGQIGARLHALMFTAHSYAILGQPAAALRTLAQYDEALERTQILRFAGRGENFRGWVLRNLGAGAAADEENRRALTHPAAIPETPVAADLDLAEGCLQRGDLDGAEAGIGRAERALGTGTILGFGWRQALKIRSHRARLRFAHGDWDGAAGIADDLATTAAELGLPRYAVPARILVARARARAGDAVDRDAVANDLDHLDDAVAIESWWLTAEAARDLDVPAWRARAEQRAARLAAAAGPAGEPLLPYATSVLDAR